MLLKKKMSFIYIFLLILDFVLIGGILPLLERKFLSLVQRRVGPNYVGYKGRLQFLADAIKVFLKDFLYLAKINQYYYLVFPFIFFYINVLFVFLFFYCENIYLLDTNYYIIYMYLLIIYSNIVLLLSGIFSKNKYSILSAQRIAVFIYSLDFLMTVFILILLVFCESFNFFNLKNYKFLGIINLHFIIFLPYIFLIFLLDANKAPFDLFEAESELVMGYSTEYSGFLFGVYVLVEYLHIFFFSFLIVNMLF